MDSHSSTHRAHGEWSSSFVAVSRNAKILFGSLHTKISDSHTRCSAPHFFPTSKNQGIKTSLNRANPDSCLSSKEILSLTAAKHRSQNTQQKAAAALHRTQRMLVLFSSFCCKASAMPAIASPDARQSVRDARSSAGPRHHVLATHGRNRPLHLRC